MEPAGPSAQVSESKGTLADTVARQAQQQNQVLPGLGSITDVRREIDDCLADMRDFYRAEPDQVMQAVSAHSARLVEIVIRVQRVEVVRREWKPVREEADRVLTELKSQFQVASRILAMRQQDWEMSGRGQT
jgi:stage III sporulation protein SpoIIIAA